MSDGSSETETCLFSRRDFLKWAAAVTAAGAANLAFLKPVYADGGTPTPPKTAELTEAEIMDDSGLHGSIQTELRGRVVTKKFSDLTPDEKLAFGQYFDFKENPSDLHLVMLTSQSLGTMASAMVSQIVDHVLQRSRNDKKGYHCAPLANFIIREIVTAVLTNQFPKDAVPQAGKTGITFKTEEVYEGPFYDPKTKQLRPEKAYLYSGTATMGNGKQRNVLFVLNPDKDVAGTVITKPASEQMHIPKDAKKLTTPADLERAKRETYDRLRGPCNPPNGQSPKTQPAGAPAPIAVEYPSREASVAPAVGLGEGLPVVVGVMAVWLMALFAFRDRRTRYAGV